MKVKVVYCLDIQLRGDLVRVKFRQWSFNDPTSKIVVPILILHRIKEASVKDTRLLKSRSIAVRVKVELNRDSTFPVNRVAVCTRLSILVLNPVSAVRTGHHCFRLRAKTYKKLGLVWVVRNSQLEFLVAKVLESNFHQKGTVGLGIANRVRDSSNGWWVKVGG